VYNVFTPTRNVRDLSIHRNDKEHTNTFHEHEDNYVEVVEKYTLVNGANKFTLMKHKHKRHTNE